MSPRVVTDPQVSILLLTRNGASTLPALLDALDAQVSDVPFEIIAIDSASTDGTPHLLEPRVDTLLTIDPSAFNHGATRNLAMQRARGTLAILLVQDALPTGTTWLSSLIAPFAEDSVLAGTFSRQLPRRQASAITRLYMDRWFASRTEPRRVSIAYPSDLDQLAPLEQLDRCTFDNVCACIRTRVWQAIPFPTTPIAEDLEWSRAVLKAGYAIAYVPAAVVEHSHDRSVGYEFARTYTLHRRLFELFRVRTIPSVWSLLLSVAACLRLHVTCVRSSQPPEPFGAYVRALGLAVSWPLGQYLGGLSAAKGWRPMRFTGV